MEATVAERGQITLPKAVRDALGLTKGTQLKVELDGSTIILRKNVDDAISRLRGRFKLAGRQHRRRAARHPWPGTRRSDRAREVEMIAVDSSVLVDVLVETFEPMPPKTACARRWRRPGGGLRRGRHRDGGRARLRRRLFDVLEEAGIGYLATEVRAAVRAGDMQRRFKQRPTPREALSSRTVPDFLIGAHALLQCEGARHARRRFLSRLFQGPQGHRAEAA